MQWNILLYVIKLCCVDRLPYVLYRIRYLCSADISAQLDNHWNYFC